MESPSDIIFLLIGIVVTVIGYLWEALNKPEVLYTLAFVYAVNVVKGISKELSAIRQEIEYLGNRISSGKDRWNLVGRFSRSMAHAADTYGAK